MAVWTARLLEASTGNPVDAVLTVGLTAAEVVAAEAAWAPHRRSTPETEHSHWNWARKSRLLDRPAVTCVGIGYADEMQGMMLVESVGHTVRLPSGFGEPLVYVEFIEAAPWNVPLRARSPRFRRVGYCLVGAAIRLSFDLGHDGRIGLHSLPQSEGFYERGIGMTPWGQDPEYNGLM